MVEYLTPAIHPVPHVMLPPFLCFPSSFTFMNTVSTAEAQSQLAVAMERERNAQEEALQLRTETSALNSQVGLLRQERGRLQVQLEAERSRAQEIQEEMGRYAVLL